MKYFISLVLCCCFLSYSRADEFKLEFSKDLIDAAGTEQSGIETPASSKAVKPNNPILVPAPPIPQSQTEPPLDASGENQLSPAERINVKQPAYSSRTDYARSNDNFAPLRMSPDKVFGGLGALLPSQSDQLGSVGQKQQNIDVFDQLHDEFKLMVGDDTYDRVAWTYDSVKELDNWLSASFGQWMQFGSGLISVGLNDQVIADFTAQGQIGGLGRNAKSVEDSHADALKTPEYAARYGINQAAISANFENQSKFLIVLEYLTLSNLLYLVLSVIALVYAIKFFRFLIKLR